MGLSSKIIVTCLLRSIAPNALQLAITDLQGIDSVQKIDRAMSTYFDSTRMKALRSLFYSKWTQGNMTMTEYCTMFDLVADEIQLSTASHPIEFIARMREGSAKN